MIEIYISPGEIVPLSSFVEEGLINITRLKPKFCIAIERKKCACNTIDDIAIYKDSIFIRNKNQYVVGSSCYQICSNDVNEFMTSVLWLIKSHFYTFFTHVCKYFSKRTQSMETTLERKMTPFFFDCTTLDCNCLKFTLKDVPVFCLKHIVLCQNKKGPTINSVI